MRRGLEAGLRTDRYGGGGASCHATWRTRHLSTCPASRVGVASPAKSELASSLALAPARQTGSLLDQLHARCPFELGGASIAERRHTYGTLLAQAGFDGVSLQRATRHRNFKMRARYVHRNVDDLRAAADYLPPSSTSAIARGSTTAPSSRADPTPWHRRSGFVTEIS